MPNNAKPLYVADHLEHNAAVEIKEGIAAQPFFHRHNGYEFFLFLDGDINFYIGKECYCPPSGCLFLIPPNEYHRMVCSEQSTCYRRAIIYLLPQYLNSLSTASTDLSRCLKRDPHGSIRMAQLTKEQAATFLRFAEELDEYLQLKSYGDDLRIQVSVIQLMLFINSVFQEDTPIAKRLLPRIVTETMAYVEQNLTEDFSIEQLAKDLFHNRSYVSRTFHEVTGITLQQYIIDRRIFLAQHLLKHGETVANACYKSGFRNYANFIRTFTKNVGTSPLRYQKEQLKTNS